jgi:serine/threonine protein kinase
VPATVRVGARPGTDRQPSKDLSGPLLPGYEILGELGRGGMAVVYKARQKTLDRLVALKVVDADPRANPELVARSRAEASAVAQLRHPHVVQIYEVGEHDGLHYLALELVDGPTLADRLAGAPQPSRPAAELVETLARAVHAAHTAGVVHRDLKPSNVLLAPPSHGARGDCTELYGFPKVTDFGIAKRLDADSPGHTRTGFIVGTPDYMAPEQACGRREEVGPAADVYALGVILYEMLVGRPPFKAATSMETMRLLTTEEPMPPRRLQPYVPRDLETICLKCLQKDPNHRYPTALALAEDLRRYAHGEPTLARPPGPAGRVWRWCRRYPLVAGLLAAMVLCLVGGFAYLSRLTDHLVQSAALESAAQQSDLLAEVNNSYADVVKRAKAGHLTVTHDYAGDPAAIPIPATFTIELGQQISDRSETGAQVRLYSDHPFRSRRGGGPKDDFERDALRRLREDPDKPVWRFEDYKGRPSLRYATARQMQQACVDCHNSHPDSPKTDWKVGDVRGVVEIIHPLDRDADRARDGLRGAFVFVGAVSAALLGLSWVALSVGGWRRGRGPF